VNEQLAVLREESVAVQVTVVDPTEKSEPEGGSQLTSTQLPVAVGAA
jgi:hypothetical protein